MAEKSTKIIIGTVAAIAVGAAAAGYIYYAQQYKQMIEERFHPKGVFINDVYPFCGINVGPGLMAAYYMGKPISADLSVERALIEKFIAEAK